MDLELKKSTLNDMELFQGKIEVQKLFKNAKVSKASEHIIPRYAVLRCVYRKTVTRVLTIAHDRYKLCARCKLGGEITRQDQAMITRQKNSISRHGFSIV